MAVKCAQESTHLNDGKYFILLVFQMTRISYYSERVIHELMEIVNESMELKEAKNDYLTVVCCDMKDVLRNTQTHILFYT